MCVFILIYLCIFLNMPFANAYIYLTQRCFPLLILTEAFLKNLLSLSVWFLDTDINVYDSKPSSCNGNILKPTDSNNFFKNIFGCVCVISELNIYHNYVSLFIKMATAAGYADGQLDIDEKGQMEENQKERFHIRFQYLRSEKTVEKCFIDKLPSHIKPIDRSKIWKGLFIYVTLYTCKYWISIFHLFPNKWSSVEYCCRSGWILLVLCYIHSFREFYKYRNIFFIILK